MWRGLMGKGLEGWARVAREGLPWHSVMKVYTISYQRCELNGAEERARGYGLGLARFGTRF